MPNLVSRLRDEVSRAAMLARAGETLRASLLGDPRLGRELTLFRLHFLYEIAYLHVFVNWEAFLEESFLRYLCGYFCSTGKQVTVTGNYAGTLAVARTQLFGGHPYLLWHGASTIEARSRIYFIAGLHETVVASSRSRLEWFAAIRHYIAHKHEDARGKFDAACMNLCGRRFRGSRPGAFLRERTTSGVPPLRWLELIGDELVKLAAQIVP